MKRPAGIKSGCSLGLRSNFTIRTINVASLCFTPNFYLTLPIILNLTVAWELCPLGKRHGNIFQMKQKYYFWIRDIFQHDYIKESSGNWLINEWKKKSLNLRDVLEIHYLPGTWNVNPIWWPCLCSLIKWLSICKMVQY